MGDSPSELGITGSQTRSWAVPTLPRRGQHWGYQAEVCPTPPCTHSSSAGGQAQRLLAIGEQRGWGVWSPIPAPLPLSMAWEAPSAEARFAGMEQARVGGICPKVTPAALAFCYNPVGTFAALNTQSPEPAAGIRPGLLGRGRLGSPPWSSWSVSHSLFGGSCICPALESAGVNIALTREPQSCERQLGELSVGLAGGSISPHAGQPGTARMPGFPADPFSGARGFAGGSHTALPPPRLCSYCVISIWCAYANTYNPPLDFGGMWHGPSWPQGPNPERGFAPWGAGLTLQGKVPFCPFPCSPPCITTITPCYQDGALLDLGSVEVPGGLVPLC